MAEETLIQHQQEDENPESFELVVDDLEKVWQEAGEGGEEGKVSAKREEGSLPSQIHKASKTKIFQEEPSRQARKDPVS